MLAPLWRGMRKQDQERFRKILGARLVALYRQAMGKLRDGTKRETFEQNEPRDEGDDAVRSLDYDTSMRMGERETALAVQIEAALQRIDDGSYGVCIECDQPIEMERLRAVPWAVRCIADQEAFEFEARDITPSL
jgi:DnaK suppressor protein